MYLRESRFIFGGLINDESQNPTSPTGGAVQIIVAGQSVSLTFGILLTSGGVQNTLRNLPGCANLTVTGSGPVAGYQIDLSNTQGVVMTLGTNTFEFETQEVEVVLNDDQESVEVTASLGPQ